MAKKVFKEKQQFRNLEVIGFIAFFMVGVFYKLVNELLTHGNTLDINEIVCIGLLMAMGFLIRFLLQMEMKVSVTDKSIKYKMTPLHGSAQEVPLKEIESYDIIKTPVLAQWHGGNISFNHERRYSFSGRNGVQLRTKDGQEYFIGSNRLEELRNAIEKVLCR